MDIDGAKHWQIENNKDMRLKLSLIFCLAFLFSFSQRLERKQLSKSEINSGIVKKYSTVKTINHYFEQLLLYANGKYRYCEMMFDKKRHNEGTWKRNDGVLVLTSDIRKDNLPVKLSYVTDSINVLGGFKVGMVQNLVGQLFEDAMVNINNDSIKCVPSGGFCTSDLQSIDSIKVVFENGLCSKWVKVERKSYSLLLPIILVDYNISNYKFFTSRKYKIRKSFLQRVD